MMHITLLRDPIINNDYKSLLSNVDIKVFSMYVYIFNRVLHTNVPYLDKELSNDEMYKGLEQLESLGLISITMEDDKHW